MKKLPIDTEIAFMNQIESAAQGWKDGVIDYYQFRTQLRRHCTNIYNAAAALPNNAVEPTTCKEWNGLGIPPHMRMLEDD